MPKPRSEPQRARDELAAAARRHGPNSPEALAARRRLDEANLTARIRQLAADAPPLTPRQLAELRPLLEPVRGILAADATPLDAA